MLTPESPLSELTADELAAITHDARRVQYPKNTVVIAQGDSAGSFYFIERGRVKIFVADDDGREVLLNTQTAGEYFGELALLDDSPRSAMVMTLEPTTLRVVTQESFIGSLEAHPKLALKLISGLSRRVRALTRQVESLALLDVYGRVRKTLIDLTNSSDGKGPITQPLTHQDLANRVGSSREMVSRIMKTLVDGKYVRADRKHIVIERTLPERW